MGDEFQNNYRNEEEEEMKKMKQKQIESGETENHEEDGTKDIKARQISENSDRVPPVVANFAPGYDPKPDDRGPPRITVKDESNQRLQVVVSQPRPMREKPAGPSRSNSQQGADKKTHASNRNTPLYKLTAMSPSEAYPIDMIIEREEWDFLQDIYWLLHKEDGPATDFDPYPLFVRNRLDKLRETKDETGKQKLSAILSLLTHLVRFKDLYSNTSSITTLAENHLFPSVIFQKCVKLFLVRGSPEISSDKLECLISYVLVLALHVDKFKIDPQDIAEDLRMSTVILREHFEKLGCKFVCEESVELATLPVPLKFRSSSRRSW